AVGEIRTTDVASAEHGDETVDDHRLVVHAAIEPPALDDELYELRGKRWLAGAERVEDPHLDLRVGVGGAQQPVLVLERDVVQQQPHPYSTIGSREQPLRH